MTAVAGQLVITEPGVYPIPEDAYHADPVPGGSLSASGAKKLLDCPARFEYDREHPARPTAAMELGTAAHKLVLGTGADLVPIDAENYRTKAAQEAARDARGAGKIPLLPHELAGAEAIADAVLAHPLAGPLFDPEHGVPERSLFWRDDATGVQLRARLDWLPFPGQYGRRMVIPDLKTCACASPAAITRAVASLSYHIQDSHYTDGVKALGLDDDPAFIFVFAETAPPYLVTLAELDGPSKEAGRAAMRRAAERFRDCTESGIWPGYSQDIELISLPPWVARTEEYA